MVFCRFLGYQDRRYAIAHVAQSAERVLGKDEVISSTLIMGSSFLGIEKNNLNSRKLHGEKRSVSKD